MVRKTIDKMSANELYKLAQKREQEELKKLEAEKAAEIDSLRKERKALVADHNKALRAIDKKISALTGKKTKPRKSTAASTKASGHKRGSLTAAIIEILSSQESVTTNELRTQLKSKGLVSKNLNQQLAYLKRQGQVTSPSRGSYSAA